MIADIHTHTFCPAVEPLVRDLPGYAAIPYKRDMSPGRAALHPPACITASPGRRWADRGAAGRAGCGGASCGWAG